MLVKRDRDDTMGPAEGCLSRPRGPNANYGWGIMPDLELRGMTHDGFCLSCVNATFLRVSKNGFRMIRLMDWLFSFKLRVFLPLAPGIRRTSRDRPPLARPTQRPRLNPASLRHQDSHFAPHGIPKSRVKMLRDRATGIKIFSVNAQIMGIVRRRGVVLNQMP